MKKYILIVIILFCANLANAQIQQADKMATTTTLPAGTTVKDGKITVMSGYRASYGEKDKNVVIVQRTLNRIGGNGITGSFTCLCSEDNSKGDCSIFTSGNEVGCQGVKCKCYMSVVINPVSGAAITRQTKGETWKKFMFPVRRQ